LAPMDGQLRRYAAAARLARATAELPGQVRRVASKSSCCC
jgi:hypothetical protein